MCVIGMQSLHKKYIFVIVNDDIWDAAVSTGEFAEFWFLNKHVLLFKK